MRIITKVLAVLMVVTLVFSAVAFGAADKHRAKLWSFETGTTEGYAGFNKGAGKLSVVTKDQATDGTKMLKADITGSTGWNQDAIVLKGKSNFPAVFHNLVGLYIDVYVPKSSIKGMTYQELYIVISGKANSWYQLKKPLVEGMNKLYFKLDNSKLKGELWDMYFILNNSEPWAGPIYIDNIVGKVMGQPGNLKGKAVDKASGKGISDALVVVGDALTKTDGGGNFKITVPEDNYKVEIVKFGFKKKSLSGVEVTAHKTNNIGKVEVRNRGKVKSTPVKVTIDASKVLRKIDPHKMYGENLAAWHPVDGYRNNDAIKKIKDLNATMIRIPGGDYGNVYDWKTGQVYKLDGGNDWTPELNYYGVMVPFMKRMDKEMNGKMEVLPIVNIMTPNTRSIQQRIDYAIAWVQDMKSKGLRVNYVEVGNEPDSKNKVLAPSDEKNWLKSPTSKTKNKWFTSISNYTKVYMQTAYQMKKAFGRDLKLMGPCAMQPLNKQRLAGEPWKAEQENPESPYWVEKFLKIAGKAGYVDAIAVHEYPLWANNNAVALLKKPQRNVPEYMGKYKKWIKKYVNSKKGYENKHVEICLTEWNSGEENAMTVMLENSIFAADYLGSFIKEGGDMALIWDLYTQKPGLGGGHGLMDAENDPTDKFSPRGNYWVIQMFAKHFGIKLVKSISDKKKLSVYSSITKDGKLAILAINKTSLRAFDTTFAVSGKGVGNGKAYQFSEKEYVWSKALYRPIVNTGPSKYNVKGGNKFKVTLPPYSITMLVMD